MSLTVKLIGAVAVVAVAIIIGLLTSSLRKLNSDEVGLQYDVHQRTLKTEVFTAGLHLGPPGYKFIKFPYYQHVAFPSLKCLNKDGLDVEIIMEFQYLPSAEKKDLKQLILDYRNHAKYKQVITDTSLQVIHDICSEFSITDFQTSRAEFQNKLLTSLDKRLYKDCLASIRDVHVSNIQRPLAYEGIIRDKESARQNIQVALQERGRIIKAAQTKVKEATARANLTLIRAESDGRIASMNAIAQAKAILNAYSTEAETYSQIIINQNLTISGLLSYLRTRSIQSSEKQVHVNMNVPGNDIQEETYT